MPAGHTSLGVRSPLPPAVGGLTEELFERLRHPPHALPDLPDPEGDPLDDVDHHLALYVCCELAYRGWDDVDETWEWEATLTRLRLELEGRFENAVVEGVSALPDPCDGDMAERLTALIDADESPSVARYLASKGSAEQIRELMIHRSLYGLKEGDPHVRVIPRLPPDAKAALVEILADEYGGGHPLRLHSELYRQTLSALGLDETPNAYVGVIPGVTLATLNLMSLFGAHARLRGAVVGHFAVTEMTSSQANRLYGQAVRRAGFASRSVTHYFDEHVEADAVHDAVAAHDLAGGLANAEPEQAERIVFGGRALMLVEGRLAHHLLRAWENGASSLRAI